MRGEQRQVLGVRLAVIVAVIAAMFALPTSASAQTEPMVSLSVSTDLQAGDTIDVSAAGFTPNEPFVVLMCLGDSTTADNGDLGTADLGVQTDGVGSFTHRFTVARQIAAAPVTGGDRVLFDCAEVACDVVVSSIDQGEVGRTPISLVGGVLPARSFTIEGSIPGPLTVVGSGLPAARNLVLYFDACNPGGSCLRQHVGSVTTLVDGTLDAELDTFPVFGSTLSACLTGTCVITAVFPQILGPDFVVATAPVTLVVPEFTAEVESFATLGTTNNEVVATALVSCDRATPFSLWAYLTQGDAVWRYRLNGQSCVPGDPTKVWIPSRLLVDDGGPFELSEPVGVELRISPLSTTHVSHQTVVGGSTTLLDSDTVGAAILDQLQAPGSEAMVAQILRDISLRFAQDAVFRAALIAAINAG